VKRLCSICARGGSKGVPNKNLKIINGKPLISYTLRQARKSCLFEKIVVSSDSDEILEYAKNNGADLVIKRSEEMASDTAAKLPAIIHCAEETERLTGTKFDVFVDLDCTSPLRSQDDILGAIKLLESENASNVITGSLARRSPYFNLVEIKEDGTVGVVKTPPANVVRRQDSPKCYDMNASIYVWTRASLLGREKMFNANTRLFEMPDSRSLDIDSNHDFELVEFMLSKRTDQE
jgi:CMP-N,N'-diacetyllegionaminic acid synthase